VQLAVCNNFSPWRNIP